jgi:uncharacterized membrane protein
MLIVFPLGLLMALVIYAIVFLMTAHTRVSLVAYGMLVAGIMGGIITVSLGW